MEKIDREKFPVQKNIKRNKGGKATRKEINIEENGQKYLTTKKKEKEGIRVAKPQGSY